MCLIPSQVAYAVSLATEVVFLAGQSIATELNDRFVSQKKRKSPKIAEES